MEPRLTIETGKGIDRVTVDFDPGTEQAAFALLQRALPAFWELDRCVRGSSSQPFSPETVSGRPHGR